MDYLAQKRYLEKLVIEDVTLPDPYGIAEELWIDDMSIWPDLQYGDVYNYLIESKGQFTKENLRAFKSLEAFNYFYNGHVRTVFCHCFGRYVIMKARVNPSQRNPDEAHTAWTIIHKTTGEVKAGHCDCKAGLGEVCSHVAAVLFKVETAVTLGLTKLSCTSRRCQWNNCYKENVHPAEAVNVEFVKPLHPSKRKTLTTIQPSAKLLRTAEYTAQINEDDLYKPVFNVVPNACLFTIIQHSAESSTPQSSAESSTPQSSAESSTAQFLAESSTNQSTTMNKSTAKNQCITESSMTLSTTESATIPTAESYMIRSTTKSSTTQSTTSLAESQSITESSTTQSTAESSATQSTVTQSITECQSTTESSTTQSTTESSTTQSTTESSTSQSVDHQTDNSILAGSAELTSLPSKLVIDYFDANYQKLDGATLLARAKQIFINMEVNDNESKLIEQCTKEQRESNQWFLYRRGRITASSFHDVYALKPLTDPKKLINKLMHSPDLSQIPAIKWGIDHEDVARTEYVALMNKSHNNFKCNTSGLNVNPNYPHLGASPDALTECTCCVGEGIVEIKCPFSGREKHPSELMKTKGFFLNEKGLLNRSHRYFTQVQGQLLITGRKHCDFVVWTPLGIRVHRIYEDYMFTEKLVKKLTSFYVERFLPVIMTDNMSAMAGYQSNTQNEISSDEDDQLYCYCQRGESGKMIECENKECKIGWFHFTCVGIRRVPKGQWFCPDCKK